MTAVSGPAIFFDGVTSARHPVRLDLEDATLVVRSGEGGVLARWPVGDLAQVSWEDGVLRLGQGRGGSLARIEVRD